MLKFSQLILLMTVALVPACSTSRMPPKDMPQPKEYFSTKITDSGLKIFTYTLEMPLGNGFSGGPPNGGMHGNRPDPSMNKAPDSLDQMLNTRLMTKLGITGYCRKGHTELDRHVYGSRLSIRGECNDLATEEDRERFTTK